MKLDNRGWGYRDMIIYSSIIIICLIIVVVFSNIIHNQMESFSPSYEEVQKKGTDSSLDKESYTYYQDKEKRLNDAAKIYIQKNNYEITTQKIELNTLVGFGYMNKVIDKDNSECDGYVVVSSEQLQPYLKCKNYITKGYEE